MRPGYVHGVGGTRAHQLLEAVLRIIAHPLLLKEIEDVVGEPVDHCHPQPVISVVLPGTCALPSATAVTHQWCF